MSLQINRFALKWEPVKIHDFLRNHCLERPREGFAPTLHDVWHSILGPFFAASPLGGSSHPRLDNNVSSRTIWAPIDRSRAYMVAVTDVCEAIAYVLSTCGLLVSSRKSVLLAALYVHFCRLVPYDQRKPSAHFLWTSNSSPDRASFREDSPIILTSNLIYEARDTSESRGIAPNTSNSDQPPPGYYLVEMSEFMETHASNYRLSYGSVPSCYCSRLIPVIWSLSKGRAATGFSADLTQLAELLREYRDGLIPFQSLVSASRASCENCHKALAKMGVPYADIGAVEISDSSGSNSHNNTPVSLPLAISPSPPPNSLTVENQPSSSSRRRRTSMRRASGGLPYQPAALQYMQPQYGVTYPTMTPVNAHSISPYNQSLPIEYYPNAVAPAPFNRSPPRAYSPPQSYPMYPYSIPQPVPVTDVSPRPQFRNGYRLQRPTDSRFRHRYNSFGPESTILVSPLY